MAFPIVGPIFCLIEGFLIWCCCIKQQKYAFGFFLGGGGLFLLTIALAYLGSVINLSFLFDSIPLGIYFPIILGLMTMGAGFIGLLVKLAKPTTFYQSPRR
jgi:hypothetical protein